MSVSKRFSHLLISYKEEVQKFVFFFFMSCVEMREDWWDESVSGNTFCVTAGYTSFKQIYSNNRFCLYCQNELKAF
jgi:hypothetical protein